MICRLLGAIIFIRLGFVFCLMKRGVFVVVDGLDGVGKGVIEDAIIGCQEGKVFDSVKWSLENLGRRPNVGLVAGKGFSCVSSAEPTHSLLGADIRWEMISKSHDRVYSAKSLVQAYSLDREIQMKRLVVPVLLAGIDVVQSRSFAVSCCYQMLNAEDEGGDPNEILEYILRQPGNKFQLENAPDLLIIPVVVNVEELIARLEKRGKTDDAIFENLEFQKRAKVLFESVWLREIFEKAGTKVAYLDAGISVESTRAQAVEIYNSWRTTGKVSEKFTKILGS